MSTADLPSDLDAERFVLGGIFRGSRENPDFFATISEALTDAMFSLERHKCLFAAMRSVFNHGLTISAESVRLELERAGRITLVGPFIDLAVEFPDLVNIEGYCQIIAESCRLRELYSQTIAIQSRILQRDDSESIISDTQKSFSRIESTIAEDDGCNPEEIIKEAGDINVFLSPELRPGLMMPWSRLNYVTNGLKRGELIVIGAKPGIGKTSIACNVALRAAINGHLTRIESYEMLPADLLFRMICSHASVDSQEARAGRLHVEDRTNLARATSEILDCKDYLSFSRKPKRTIPGISAYLRKQRVKGRPVRLVIIDYLQKMRGIGKFERRDLEVANIAVGMKDLSVDFELPVLALAQLSVDAKEQFKQPPTIDDFRESKAIGMESDVAIILRLEDAEQLYKPSRRVNLYLVKQRNGATAKVPFLFHAKYCLYEETPEDVREVA